MIREPFADCREHRHHPLVTCGRVGAVPLSSELQRPHGEVPDRDAGGPRTTHHVHPARSLDHYYPGDANLPIDWITRWEQPAGREEIGVSINGMFVFDSVVHGFDSTTGNVASRYGRSLLLANQSFQWAMVPDPYRLEPRRYFQNIWSQVPVRSPYGARPKPRPPIAA